LAIPEHKVALQGGLRPSQNDVWALARAGGDLVSITVEGKVEEPFDQTVKDWMAHSTPGKRGRLSSLAKTIGIDVSQLPEIRYQLLYRTASAIIEAERYSAEHAIMLVHSFSEAQAHFLDFRKFVGLFGQNVRVDRVASVERHGAVMLHFVWVSGNRRYLAK
jgi:hypothetical protein